MRRAGTGGAAAGPRPQLLLCSQLIFNVGFYSVVPFLAVAMRDDFGMGAMAIGIVLGARTFAQQGLYLLGGALADRWGPRRSLISGCLVRVSGYLLLVWAADFPLFLLGAVVTGIGGALFSPGMQSLVGSVAERRAPKGSASASGGDRKNQGSSLFALLVVCGEVGTVLGPLLGGLLLPAGFDTALLTGAGVFAAMALVFVLFLPRSRRRTSPTPSDQREPAPPSDLWSCLAEKKFMGFCAFYSVNLLATNQLYFGLPVELERSGAGADSLGVVFAYASVLTIALQWPIARLMRRAGPRVALSLGFSLQSLGFTALAVLAIVPPPGGFPTLPAMAWVTGLALGNMCVMPMAMGLVLEFAAGRPTGAYFGLLATAGGLAVVAGNAALAPLYELAVSPGPTALAPWLLLALCGATTATVIHRFLPTGAVPARTADSPTAARA